MKLRRGGYATGDWSYSKLLKVRVMPMTYNELLKLQEQKGLSMAQLIRKMIHFSMDKDIEEGPAWIDE